MDDKDQLCKDLGELFTALPQTNDAKTEMVKLARSLILGLIGTKLDRFRDL